MGRDSRGTYLISARREYLVKTAIHGCTLYWFICEKGEVLHVQVDQGGGDDGENEKTIFGLTQGGNIDR